MAVLPQYGDILLVLFSGSPAVIGTQEIFLPYYCLYICMRQVSATCTCILYSWYLVFTCIICVW